MRPALALLVALLLPPGAHGQDIERCVEARIGGDVAYSCLNEAWARLVDRTHMPQVPGTLGATSPAPAVGTFNRTATAERMGNAFGHSVIPQRPAAPVFVNPLQAGPVRH